MENFEIWDESVPTNESQNEIPVTNIDNEEKSLDESITLTTTAEQFLEQHYEFRRNTLRGLVEYRPLDGTETPWAPVTDEVLNTIILHSKHEMGEDSKLKGDIKLYLGSTKPEEYDPIRTYLINLPAWDKVDRVVDFCTRIPGITADQVYLLSIWIRSVVAHWLNMDHEHGNEMVPLFIGDQGIGKTTLCTKFLPPELRCYFLDHFNLGNKFDKEMALARSLLINLDEIDRYTPRQMADIKQALSKSMVNSRQIYGRSITLLDRKASFIGTTNCRQPLVDISGSRRFLCIEIPKGTRIDYESEFDYEQFFAQIMHELQVEHARYWYNAEETQRIQDQNLPYQRNLELDKMIKSMFRKPNSGEKGTPYSTDAIQKALLEEFPRILLPQMSSVKIGKVMKELEVEKKKTMHGAVYNLICMKSA